MIYQPIIETARESPSSRDWRAERDRATTGPERPLSLLAPFLARLATRRLVMTSSLASSKGLLALLIAVAGIGSIVLANIAGGGSPGISTKPSAYFAKH